MESNNKRKLWCRVEIGNGNYHYVYVDQQFAIALCMQQGYTIDIPEHMVPADVRNEILKHQS